MACGCSTKPNYKGPGVGIWALALGVEFSVGCIMILLGSYTIPEDIKEVNNYYNNIISYIIKGGEEGGGGNEGEGIFIMGWIYIILSSFSSIFVLLGLFICNIFMCPLCILGYIQTIYCGVCTVYTAIYLRKYYDILPINIDNNINYNNNNLFINYYYTFNTIKDTDVFYAQLNSSGLLIACVLSFTAAILLARASKVSSGDSVPGAYMMIHTMALYAILCALLGGGGGGVSPCVSLCILYLLLVIGGSILINIRQCCCINICNILMIILYIIGLLLSFITFIYYVYIYTIIIDVHTPEQQQQLQQQHNNYYLLFFIMHKGNTIILVAALSLAAAVMSLITTAYAARSLLCCGGGVTSN